MGIATARKKLFHQWLYCLVGFTQSMTDQWESILTSRQPDVGTQLKVHSSTRASQEMGWSCLQSSITAGLLLLPGTASDVSLPRPSEHPLINVYYANISPPCLLLGEYKVQYYGDFGAFLLFGASRCPVFLPSTFHLTGAGVTGVSQLSAVCCYLLIFLRFADILITGL